MRIKTANALESDVKSYEIKIGKVIITPQSIVTGNDKIEIMNHSLHEPDSDRSAQVTAIDIAVRNISDKNIATAIFEANFYDSEGNILDTVRHRELELNAHKSRAIAIVTGKVRSVLAKSYNVNLLKTITTDIEKVHLRAHKIRTNLDGGEEVEGFLRNISDVKADVALVAEFTDSKDVVLGTRILLIKDIESNSSQKFHFIFYPPQGEKVNTYTINIGEIVYQF